MHFIYLFHAIMSHGNLASTFGQPYCTDIALLSHPHMVILLPYMAGGGGRGGVCLTLNAKMYIMCTILFLPPTCTYLVLVGFVRPRFALQVTVNEEKKNSERLGDLIQKIWCICRTSTDGCTERTSYRGPVGIVWIWFKEVE